MVSFQCETCGDTLTKKKLDPHVNRCYNAYFTCIDCMTTFDGTSYRSHTSCISEAQKYQGALYRDKKTGTGKRENPSKDSNMNGSRTPRSAYMEPMESPAGNQLARLQVPPPAPSPPTGPSPIGAVGSRPTVFDFLVTENNGVNGHGHEQASPSSSTSSYASGNDDSLSSATSSPVQPKAAKYREGIDFSYGSGPIERGLQKFDSSNDLGSQLDNKFGPLLSTLKTPAPQRDSRSADDGKQAINGKSDKKRKRVEDLDLSVARKNRAGSLHSGLTGGLSKLMAPNELLGGEASPLSPKKKTKRSKDEIALTKISKAPSEISSRKSGEKAQQERQRRRESRTVSASSSLKLIEAGPKRQRPDQSHSEFFLTLVDKDHRSSKGQSIWGALKTFHEGVYADLSQHDTGIGTENANQKRLFKGLRMKINKQGEIVLFSRPDKEIDDMT